MDKFTRCFAEIDLEAIRHNFRQLRSLCGDGVKSIAVVKANAYGHGSVKVAHALSGMADIFAVASVEEAVELRKGGIREEILVLGYCDKSEYSDLLIYDITATVYTLTDGESLNSFAEGTGRKMKVHLAIDTGMGRIGFPCDAISEAVAVCKLPNLEVAGIFSHYAKADMKDKTDTRRQTERFDGFISALEKKGITLPLHHICNSAGIIDLDRHYDAVRMGIGLYGAYPSDEVEMSLDLHPAMKVKTHIIHVKTVPAGTPIGYGGAYVTEKETAIATLSIGYADGYKRGLSGKAYVLIKGRKAPITGRVCMDQIMVDVTDIPDVRVGMTATVLGRDGEEEITADYLGNLCDSFSYEIFCSFSERVKRIYTGE